MMENNSPWPEFVKEMREKLQKHVAKKIKNKKTNYKQPRYDTDYENFVDWIDKQ